MTTTTPAAEADRILALLRPGALTSPEVQEYTAVYGRDPLAVAQHAQALYTKALVEQQRIGNLIAAYDRDALIYPALGSQDRAVFEARIAQEVSEAVVGA